MQSEPLSLPELSTGICGITRVRMIQITPAFIQMFRIPFFIIRFEHGTAREKEGPLSPSHDTALASECFTLRHSPRMETT